MTKYIKLIIKIKVNFVEWIFLCSFALLLTKKTNK